MFPVGTKEHQMTNRNIKKPEIQHANTARLMKSFIPNMQRILNISKNTKQSKPSEEKLRRPG